ncbi:RHS repeat-associated core domain-containing protein [Tahibacter amnicola]|uniref:Polymorphic toxin-type HINT domain-containing protein n=1 Tax=Tahibacter amnicola TaxID=2976241 RepID=A0ABY6BJU9_9GAMM|nr:RHS repeat-associated core domain-containing protein [Tahibacter amnicola]UXI68067.1 polymorphic toxin-type HINT domain-containing protein [Tahibacter amnicola]
MRRWLKTFATFVLVTLAGVSVDASAYARAWETESARRGFAAVLRNASSEIADVTIDRIKEKVLSAVRCTSDCPNQAYAQVIEEATSQGSNAPTVSALYTFGDDRVSQFRPAVAGGANNPGTTASLRYYHADGLGSARLLTSETGSQTDVYGYEAFGEIDEAVSQQASANDFLYTGEQRDPNTELYYLRARYMDPVAGRFTQQDSFAGVNQDPASLHKYVYVQNSPIVSTDPSGNLSLTETTVASNLRNVLASMQAEGGLVAIDVMMNRGEFDPAAYLATAGIMFAAARHLPGWLKRARPCAANSFDADTLVETMDGLTPISDIHAGMKVWGWDERRNQEGWYAVSATIQGARVYEMVELSFESGDVIDATNNHPFYLEVPDAERAGKSNEVNADELESSHWVNADMVKVGERVRLRGGRFTAVVGIRKASRQETVYNLTVEDAHTFFVGASGIQTHNTCKIFSMTQGSVLSLRAGTATAAKETGMAVDLAHHTGYHIFLPVEPTGHNISKNVDSIIETTKQGLELKQLQRGLRVQ